LRACHWNFARRQIPLTLLQDGTQGGTVPAPWLYEYAYPSDCVLMRQIMPMIQTQEIEPSIGASSAAGVVAYGQAVRFLAATDLDINGNPIEVILTNQPQAIGIYTFRNTNTAMWDALMVQSFAAYLGSRVCMTLTGDKTTMRMALAEAQQYATDAQRMNGNEGLTVIDSTPDWMRVRGYASDWSWPDGGMFSYGPQALSIIG
jgi:hypothetical protein